MPEVLSLEVSSLSHSFEDFKVLDQVSFSLPQGQIVGLIGPSGVGKSVLLKILGGVLKFSDDTSRIKSTATSLSLMFQEGALFDSMSVFDNIAFPLVDGRVPVNTLHQEERELVKQKVSEMLARVGLSSSAFKLPAQLSGGMRRRVSLARALVSRPELLLLDDPTAGLDPVASSVIMSLISDLYNEYQPTTIIVSHDLRRLFPCVQRILALVDGAVCFDGALSELAGFRHTLLNKFVTSRYDFA